VGWQKQNNWRLERTLEWSNQRPKQGPLPLYLEVCANITGFWFSITVVWSTGPEHLIQTAWDSENKL
jgi:hypothetical protein